jgi:diguanylate cyclase (GGDEF)-like protein
MSDGLRTIHLVTTDESLAASTQAATTPLGGWRLQKLDSVERLLSQPPIAGDVILLDAWLRGGNCYEVCHQITRQTRSRTFLVVEHGNHRAEPIARFSGATGVLSRPLTASALRDALSGGSPEPRPRSLVREERADAALPEALLVDLQTGETNGGLVAAMVDQETGLFNYAFLNFKLDEEFKRARRFSHPLSCVMLGFEGQAGEDALRELSAIFLESSRDTDVLGRFDESSFLFLLPCTGPDGASIMAERVAELAQERDLRDIIGDPIQIAVGISFYPHSEIEKREDLYAQARDAFESARAEGGGVVQAG